MYNKATSIYTEKITDPNIWCRCGHVNAEIMVTFEISGLKKPYCRIHFDGLVKSGYQVIPTPEKELIKKMSVAEMKAWAQAECDRMDAELGVK